MVGEKKGQKRQEERIELMDKLRHMNQLLSIVFVWLTEMNARNVLRFLNIFIYIYLFLLIFCWLRNVVGRRNVEFARKAHPQYTDIDVCDGAVFPFRIYV